MKGWCRYFTPSGSTEDDDEISKDFNLDLVDYGLVYPIVVSMVFMALTKDGVLNSLNWSIYDYYVVYVRNIVNPNFEVDVIAGWLSPPNSIIFTNYNTMNHFLQFFNKFSKQI